MTLQEFRKKTNQNIRNEKYTVFQSYHYTALMLCNGDMQKYGRYMLIINTYAIEGNILDDITGDEIVFLNSCIESINKSLELSELNSNRQKKSVEKRSNKNELTNSVANCTANSVANSEEEVEEEVEEEIEEEIEIEEEGEREFSEVQITENQENYAKQVYEVFEQNDLPRQKGGYFAFLNVLKNTEHLRKGINSNDLLEALKNYVKVLKSPECYYKQKIDWTSFLQNKNLNKFLPGNFVLENWLDFKIKDEKVKQEPVIDEATLKKQELIKNRPKVCQKCNGDLWDNSGGYFTKLLCKNCETDYVIRGDEWIML